MQKIYYRLAIILLLFSNNFLFGQHHPFTPIGQTKWWNKEIFYEIFVRSFKDSDGDGIGDFKGLTQQLDYLQQLGITAIWLMPIHPSPSYHGYDVIDYKAINPDYGTMKDFDNFITEAHKRNIKVIIDLVPNHTSNYHPWFVEAMMSKKTPKRNYYLWSDTMYQFIKPVIDPHPWHKTDHGYYYGVFTYMMPDINHTNQEVQQAFNDIIRFWLVDKHVDGYRVDAARYLVEQNNFSVLEDSDSTIQIFADYRKKMKDLPLKQEPFWVGEVYENYGDSPIIKKYIDRQAFDFCFEFQLADAIIRSLQNNNAQDIYKRMDYIIENYKYFNQYGTFLSNHDQNRIFSVFNQDISTMKLAASIYLTLPGIPFLYYGEEVGMIGKKPDEFLRTPMQWTAQQYAGFSTHKTWIDLPKDYTLYNVATQINDKNSLLNHYKKLLDIRKKYTVFSVGNYQGINVSDSGLYAYLRSNNDEHVMVIHNLKKVSINNGTCFTDQSLLTKGIYQMEVILGNDTIKKKLIVKNGGAFSFNIPELPAMQTILIALKKI